MAIKITQTLFIGLGGTGARALLRAKQCFIDAYGEVPPMIEFLAIDTDGANIGGNPIRSNAHGDIKLEKNETLYITELSALDKYYNFPTDYRWIPTQNTDYLRNIRGTGAGQVRSNGRLILQENASKIKSAIQGKVNNILNASNDPNAKYTHATKADGSFCEAIVNVVGSVAGGTGCGMMVDMLHLIPNALDATGFDYYIYPWIVMPDVYRSALPRMSDAVHLNAYGAIREMDYLFNLSLNNRTPLMFGTESLYHLNDRIDYAYIINNFNDYAGTISSSNDLADSIGRSMFLPTNDMGNAVATPMDNIRNWKPNFTIQAEGKQCWCASIGSAELVYDSQAVGDCIGYSIIRSVASQLCQSLEDKTSDVLQWMSSPEVKIQEHDADQLIDSLLNPACPFPITIDKDTTEQEVESIITTATDVETELQQNYSEIKIRVTSELNKKILNVLNTPHGVGDAEAFLNSLSAAVAVCEDEMNKEIRDHSSNYNNHVSWGNALKGIKGRFFGTDKDAAEVLAQTIASHISEKREAQRKQYALNVYAELKEQLSENMRKVQNLKDNLTRLQSLMTTWILSKQRDAATQSIFRVNLYAEDLNKERAANTNDSVLFVATEKVTDLLNATNENVMFDMMKPWADNHTEVKNAFAYTIEDKLRSMNKDAVIRLFQHLKKVSSPLWKVDYQGKIRSPKPLIDIFVVGCSDAYNNIIKDTPEYSLIFESTDGSVKPEFAAIGSNDRIQILTLSCCAPIYAVKNSTTYEKEYLSKMQYQAGYIDQSWHQRMLSEEFQIIPQRKRTGPDPLEMWVKSIVLGLIKFDDDQYWVKSKKQGMPIKGYRVILGANREVAFEAFERMSLHLECKENIDDLVSTKGKDEIQREFDKVNDENYYPEYSIISDKDKMHIEEVAYKTLQDLMNDEINFVAQGKLKV